MQKIVEMLRKMIVIKSQFVVGLRWWKLKKTNYLVAQDVAVGARWGVETGRNKILSRSPDESLDVGSGLLTLTLYFLRM